jgi:hypothetical protein
MAAEADAGRGNSGERGPGRDGDAVAPPRNPDGDADLRQPAAMPTLAPVAASAAGD